MFSVYSIFYFVLILFLDGVTEENLLKKGFVTPEDVLHLPKITEKYLCSPEANVYQIDFTRFKIRDLETGIVLFEIAKPTLSPSGKILVLKAKQISLILTYSHMNLIINIVILFKS